jgi:hypothetical protein
MHSVGKFFEVNDYLFPVCGILDAYIPGLSMTRANSSGMTC